MHLSVRKETTDTAVNTTVVSNNITVHPRVTPAVTQVVQTANFGFLRLSVAKIPTSIIKQPELGKRYGIMQEMLFSYSRAEVDFPPPCPSY